MNPQQQFFLFPQTHTHIDVLYGRTHIDMEDYSLGTLFKLIEFKHILGKILSSIANPIEDIQTRPYSAEQRIVYLDVHKNILYTIGLNRFVYDFCYSRKNQLPTDEELSYQINKDLIVRALQSHKTKLETSIHEWKEKHRLYLYIKNNIKNSGEVLPKQTDNYPELREACEDMLIKDKNSKPYEQDDGPLSDTQMDTIRANSTASDIPNENFTQKLFEN